MGLDACFDQNLYHEFDPNFDPQGYLGQSCGHLGGLWVSSWGPLGRSWGPLGAPWGDPGAILGASCEIVKLSSPSVALECDLEATWSRLGVVLGPSWGRLGAILAPLGAVLGPPWALLGPSLSHLRHLKRQCGDVAKTYKNRRFSYVLATSPHCILRCLRRLKDGLKRTPGGLKTTQRGAKMASRRPQDGPKTTPRRLQVALKSNTM